MQTRRIGPQSRFVPVMPQPLRSADPELRELRHRYNQLCARFAEVSDIDPISAANTVQELQELSDRIVAIEVRAEMAAREPRKTDAAGTGKPADSDGGRSAPLAPARRRTDSGVAGNDLPQGDAPQGESPANILALHKPTDIDDDGPDPAHHLATEPPPHSVTVPAASRPGPRDQGDAGDDAALGEAIRHWLQNRDLHGRRAPERPASPRRTGETESEPRGFDFDRLYATVKAQEAQIAAVLRRCEEHHRQLAAMERRLTERLPVGLLGPQLEALSIRLDQQRHRITALAVAIQRLLMWLATGPRRRRE